MANRRPIGRGRIPFRKGRRWISSKRPKRWNAVTTPIQEPPGLCMDPFSIPEVGDAAPAVAVLAAGQADVEPWADNQEVTIDRIVGTISVITEAAQPTQFVYGNDYYIKMGILVQEEVTQGIDPMVVNLFEQETLEDYEWMWLWSGYAEFQNGTFLNTEAPQTKYLRGLNRIDIDIRNRRKLGQSDELLLFASFCPYNIKGTGEVVLCTATVDVREMMLSK